jgi:hypothetical protein
MNRGACLVVLLVAAFSVPCSPVNARPACDPRTGDAVSSKVQALNFLKTRSEIPTAQDVNPAVTFPALIQPGNDISRWKPSMAASVVGYVTKVGVGGVETVNCHAKDAAHRDTHIDLVVSAKDANDERKHVIVELTPKLRAVMAQQGVDWGTDILRKKLLGRCAKISGWMLFDEEHISESVNTAPSNQKDWRATAWEIHPITAIEVLPACPQL